MKSLNPGILGADVSPTGHAGSGWGMGSISHAWFVIAVSSELIALKSGQTVTTSEAARQLLESARDDRLELANLLTDPTNSLLVARRKGDAKMSLSHAE